MNYIEKDILATMTTQNGSNLLEISEKTPVLLVFLRHFGCQFCRGAMDDLSKLRPKIREQNTELVFVHMADNKIAEEYFKKYTLAGVLHISDPSCHYYAHFGLVKGSFTQLFGLQSFVRGFALQAKYGAEVNSNLGDSFQMPGVFLLTDGVIKNQFIHRSAADRPDYDKLLGACLVS